MVGIVLVSHGDFSKGILQSAFMVFGHQENVSAIVLEPDEGPEDIKKKMEEAIASFDQQEEVLFLVDLWGGTPFNQATNIIKGKEDRWAIVSGLNLPMLIETLALRLTENSAQKIAKQVISIAKDGVKGFPETLEQKVNAVQQTHQAETIGRPGSFEYVLARIDTRLLHGQVATSWTRATNPNRIIIVSDVVAQDELRKRMIQQAAPPGVKAHVVPIWKMAELAKDDQHFGGQRALLLFETPQDALAAIENGVPLEELNVGSMAHSSGKVQPNKTLAFDEEDIKTFERLKDLGLTFDVRRVPSDTPEDMDEILQRAKELLQR